MPNMKERIESMAQRTWTSIGADILRALQESGRPQVMSRDEVIEVVTDASYMQTYGCDKEAYTFWNNLPNYEAKMEAVRGAFPHQRYGW